MISGLGEFRHLAGDLRPGRIEILEHRLPAGRRGEQKQREKQAKKDGFHSEAENPGEQGSTGTFYKMYVATEPWVYKEFSAVFHEYELVPAGFPAYIRSDERRACRSQTPPSQRPQTGRHGARFRRGGGPFPFLHRRETPRSRRENHPRRHHAAARRAIRILLWSRARHRPRLRLAPGFPGQPHFSHRGNHPQSGCEPPPARNAHRFTAVADDGKRLRRPDGG